MSFPSKLFGLPACHLLVTVSAFLLLGCRGSLQLGSRDVGCIRIDEVSITYAVVDGKLEISGDGAYICVDQIDDELCHNCWIRGTITIHFDLDGNRVVDTGEHVDTYIINDSGPLRTCIDLTTIEVDGITNDTRVIVTFDLQDCNGNKIKRTVSGPR